MKVYRKQISSKEPTIKHEFGKMNVFQRKKRQIKLGFSRVEKKPFGRFDFGNERNRKPQKSHTLFASTSAFKNNQTGQLNKNLSKIWWIHLWSGLVLDEEAKHQKQMKQAVWLYLYFLLVANRKNGILYRRLSTVASETGFNRRSIHRWLKLLREKGYIESRSTGRALHISITKWKPIVRRKIEEPTDEHKVQRGGLR